MKSYKEKISDRDKEIASLKKEVKSLKQQIIVLENMVEDSSDTYEMITPVSTYTEGRNIYTMTWKQE